MIEDYYLEAVDHDEGAEARFPIKRFPCTIGRGKGSDLHISLEQVSRQHARLEIGAGGLTIEDLGSTNGTFVNLERISSPVPVLSGDRIHLGSHEFVLVEDSAADPLQPPHGRSASVTAGHTILGFTAEPTGFPVQAPEFYELLNDELVLIHAQPVVDRQGVTHALALRASSRHQALDAGHEELQRLAGQLGEEVRLNQIIRQHALEAADANAMDDQPLIIPAHPNELEDIDLLEDELQQITRKYMRLQLVLEVPLGETDVHLIEPLADILENFDITLAASAINPANSDLLANLRDHVRWLIIDSRHGSDNIKALTDNPEFKNIRVIADRVDDDHGLELVRGLSGIWIRGHAAGESIPLRIQN